VTAISSRRSSSVCSPASYVEFGELTGSWVTLLAHWPARDAFLLLPKSDASLISMSNRSMRSWIS
jgi:hypothetical protein